MDFKEELKKVPELPGVYLMHDKTDKIIYVGKAKILRRRLSSYFNNSPHNERITQMISRIARFEFIVTSCEYEALLLECNLIKKHRPKYNVLLKDDKNYPFIKVTVNEPFPRLFSVHKKIKDGAEYFGPYYSSYSVDSTIKTLLEEFPLRRCRKTVIPGKTERACLRAQIGECPGACAGYITTREYKKNVDAICDFLRGKSAELIKKLKNDMLEASKNLEFEKAAGLRDRIKALETISEKQRITFDNEDSFDVLGIYQNETDAVAEVFFVRGGKISGRDFFIFEGFGNTEKSELQSSFIQQFYERSEAVPLRLFVSENFDDGERELLEEYLKSIREAPVHILTPQKGEKKDLTDMAVENGKIALENYEITRRKEAVAGSKITEHLKEALHLDVSPFRIESFDISNLGDSEIDGSMVVFEGGRAKKSDYRHYKIKTLDHRSDVGAMNEMLTRRYTRLKNGDNGFEKAPDVIFMDGGFAQVSEAEKVLAALGLKIPIFGMVKDDKHRSRGLVDPVSGAEFVLESDPVIWRLVTDIQDETHRFAVEYNRKLTEKRYKKSPLDDIKGVGNKRKIALLKHFGSVKAMREAEASEIAKVPGVSLALAEKIKEVISQ